jgi:hypothetical protein
MVFWVLGVGKSWIFPLASVNFSTTACPMHKLKQLIEIIAGSNASSNALTVQLKLQTNSGKNQRD